MEFKVQCKFLQLMVTATSQLNYGYNYVTLTELDPFFDWLFYLENSKVLEPSVMTAASDRKMAVTHCDGVHYGWPVV
jgi:hypothetical protein